MLRIQTMALVLTPWIQHKDIRCWGFMSTADFRFIKPIAITEAMLTGSGGHEAGVATYAGGTASLGYEGRVA